MIRTIDDLEDYMLLHGHKRVGEFDLSNEFIRTIVNINALDIPEVSHNSKQITKFSLKKKAYTFFNDYYKIHKIGYLPDSKLIKVINSSHINRLSDIADVYNKSAKEIDPLKLPTRYILDSINESELKTQVVLTEDKELHKRILPKMNVFFTGINLPKKNTELSTASYIHEITHSQLESYKGIIEEYNNLEVLSVFNELLYAYNYCDPIVFKELLTNRLNCLFSTFNSIYEYKEASFITTFNGSQQYNEYNYHVDVGLLVSILKALKMIALCIGEDRIQKYHIINLVNKVITGEMTVEELLDKLGINQQTMLETDHIKKLVKLL